MRRVSVSLLGLAAAAAAFPATAQPLNDRVALDLGVGTTGVVLDGEFKASPSLVLRAEANYLEFRDAFTSSDVRYGGRAHLSGGGAFIDWHPAARPWLLSAGVVAGRRKIDLQANPTSGFVKINGVSYTPSQIGSVNGSVDLGAAAPFVGFGWDNSFTAKGPIGFRALAGVVIGPDPAVALSATGPLAATPVVQSELLTEQRQLQHDVRDLQYYPLVQLGLTYRF